ncbi:MAG TPA: D-alanine--D-alanine ligase family protein [Solirubrobacteraceae bacterium]
MNIAVLSGGRSSEHEVSLASGAAVRAGLAESGHDVLDVRVGRDGTWSLGGEPVVLEPGRGLLGADCVFPALHGPFGEDGTVQGLLECLEVPYVGAGVLAAALCMDKVLFKDLMAQAGVPQVRYAALRHGEAPAFDGGLGLPVFVKPARLGSSVGIAKVADQGELDGALRTAFDHDPLVIVEAMAPGIEVECSVLGDTEPQASEPGEITYSSDWYDYEAKYTPGGMELVVPARISQAARNRVRELAVETFVRVGCSGLARVDFFVDGDEVLVNELNTMPGFTPTSVYAKLWEASGLPYPQLVDRLCAIALERHARERAYRF